ncbi:hypothetical protein Acor_82790 [Acrocarpospora corrugata]|uniref:Uncharacterized protein n=1 Tax=Acrocarpospora corrugata TaxID=35763 RepID=A0A5M3WD63_9ACTN|nr:hypothetical protein Acor_82790 [Acrocarpospora corrugata]
MAGRSPLLPLPWPISRPQRQHPVSRPDQPGCRGTGPADRAWLREFAAGSPAEWVVALDGKVLRGAWDENGMLPLFSAMPHTHGTV